MFNRRTILKGMLVGAGSAAASSFSNPIGHGDDVRRAIRIALRERDRWECAHHLFLANCIGPWVMKPLGRDLERAVVRFHCSYNQNISCSEAVGKVAELKNKGAAHIEECENQVDYQAQCCEDNEQGRGASHYAYPYDPLRNFDRILSNLVQAPPDPASNYARTLPRWPMREDGLKIALNIAELETSFCPYQPIDETKISLRYSGQADNIETVLGFLGYQVSIEKLLHHNFPYVFPRIGTLSLRHENHSELHGWFERVVSQHPSGVCRALFLQVFYGVSPTDYLSCITFLAAGEAELLDLIPTRGLLTPELQLEIFRRNLAEGGFGGAGHVGLALLRDRSSIDDMANMLNLQDGDIDCHHGKHELASLTLLNRRFLPMLRARAFHPLDDCRGYHRIRSARWQRKWRRNNAPESLDSVAKSYLQCASHSSFSNFGSTRFPFECPDMHHTLRHLTPEELNETAADERYECRIEAAIELAHRLRGRALTAMAGSAMRGAEPHDAVRLLHTLMLRDSEAARSVGLSLFEHPNWQVRLAAAGAVLNAAN